jgi:hypothetical protein
MKRFSGSIRMLRSGRMGSHGEIRRPKRAVIKFDTGAVGMVRLIPFGGSTGRPCMGSAEVGDPVNTADLRKRFP